MRIYKNSLGKSIAIKYENYLKSGYEAVIQAGLKQGMLKTPIIDKELLINNSYKWDRKLREQTTIFTMSLDYFKKRT